MAKSVIKRPRKKLQEYTCIKCKKIKEEPQFYKCSDDLVVPYCKDCVKEMALDKNGLFSRDTVKECCKIINKPFFYKKFDEIEVKPIEEYDKVNQFFKFAMKHSGKTFADSDTLNVDYKYEDVNAIDEEKDSERTQKAKKLNKRQLVRKWGTEIPDEIAFLEEEYNDWKYSGAPINTKGSRELVEQICLTKLAIRKKQKADQPVEKELRTLQDLMGNANLKPMQDAISQASDTMACLIKQYEDERPIPELATPDWIDELHTWDVGAIAKILGATGSALEEYDKILEKYSVDFELGDDEDEEEGA